jgi:hypothetical protein
VGRALHAVHGELRQRVSAAWRGGPPPRREATTRGNRFTKVRGTIPRISDASIITAFRQGVHDEKMLEKLATHQVETVTTLCALADKCIRAAEGRAWHSALQGGPAQMSWPSVAAPGSGKKKNKKNHGVDKSRVGGPIAAAAAAGGQNSRGKRPRQ